MHFILNKDFEVVHHHVGVLHGDNGEFDPLLKMAFKKLK